jgi:hypothetical protein
MGAGCAGAVLLQSASVLETAPLRTEAVGCAADPAVAVTADSDLPAIVSVPPAMPAGLGAMNRAMVL